MKIMLVEESDPTGYGVWVFGNQTPQQVSQTFVYHLSLFICLRVIR
jgi:hypothetical protein